MKVHALERKWEVLLLLSLFVSSAPLISSPTPLHQPMNAQQHNVLKKNHNSATVCTAEFFSGDEDEAHFVNWKCPSKNYYLRALRELVGIFIDTLLLLLVLCTIYIVCARARALLRSHWSWIFFSCVCLQTIVISVFVFFLSSSIFFFNNCFTVLGSFFSRIVLSFFLLLLLM